MNQKFPFSKYLNPSSPKQKLRRRIYFGILLLGTAAAVVLLVMLIMGRTATEELCKKMDPAQLDAGKLQEGMGNAYCLLPTLGHPAIVWCVAAILLLLVIASFWIIAKGRGGQKAHLTFMLAADNKATPTNEEAVKLTVPLNKSLNDILIELDAKTGTHFLKQWMDLKNECERSAEKKKTADLTWEREMKLAQSKLKDKEGTIQQLRQQNAELQEEAKKCNKKVSQMEEKFEEVKESALLLDGTRRVMEEFANRCRSLHPGSAVKEQLEWERLAITLHAYEAVCALVEVWLSQFPSTAFTTKAQWNQALQRENFVQITQTDAMVLSKLKEFVNCLNNKSKADTTDLNSRISDAIRMYYNTLSSVARITLPENKRLDEVMSNAVQAQRAAEAGSLFIDTMWDSFVKEFANEKIAQHDQSWYFEHVVNIAHHTVDYVLIQKGQPDNQCANYQFLRSGFNTDIPQCRDFESNHAEKSSKDSQLVSAWMDELGVKHLKVLIDGYFIKP